MGFDLNSCEQLQRSDSRETALAKQEKPSTLHMIFEQVSAEVCLDLDGGAISLFAASQFELPKALLVLPHQKEWENWGQAFLI